MKIQEVEGGQKFATEFPRIRDDRVGLRVSWHENKKISIGLNNKKRGEVALFGFVVWYVFLLKFPDAQCMVYVLTFTPKTTQM